MCTADQIYDAYNDGEDLVYWTPRYALRVLAAHGFAADGAHAQDVLASEIIGHDRVCAWSILAWLGY
jgi:hypothetical protein